MKNQYVRAGLVGLLGSLVMFILMMIGINGLGIAPFNISPSAVFLAKLGLSPKPLGLFVHFGYGLFWSIVLVALFKKSTNLAKGLGLAVGLWLIMMLVYSPIMGWGFFGLHGTPDLATTSPLYLQAGPKYLVATLVLHLIYGGIIGWLNTKWSIDRQSN